MNATITLMRLVCGLLVIAAMSAPQRAQAEDSTVLHLCDAVQVDAEGIYLDQVAKGSGNAALPHIRIAASPLFNRATNITRAQILEVLKNTEPNGIGTNFSGAEKVTVSRRLKPVSESDLLAMLLPTLQRGYVKDKGELELRLTRAWTPVNLPDENLEMVILDLPTSGVAPMFIVRFELRAGKEPLGVWQCSVQAKVMREVWIAKTPLRRGVTPVESDFEKQMKDVINFRETTVDISQLGGDLEMAESVSSGAVILPRHFKLRPVMRRGQNVEAVYQAGSLMISMKVELLEDGVPGQVVRVRNTQTRRDIRAKVVNDHVLMVII